MIYSLKTQCAQWTVMLCARTRFGLGMNGFRSPIKLVPVFRMRPRNRLRHQWILLQSDSLCRPSRVNNNLLRLGCLWLKTGADVIAFYTWTYSCLDREYSVQQ